VGTKEREPFLEELAITSGVVAERRIKGCHSGWRNWYWSFSFLVRKGDEAILGGQPWLVDGARLFKKRHRNVFRFGVRLLVA
jgi:hypothetical protein